MAELTDDELAALTLRHLDGLLTEDEADRLQTALKGNPAHQQLFVQLCMQAQEFYETLAPDGAAGRDVFVTPSPPVATPLRAERRSLMRAVFNRGGSPVSFVLFLLMWLGSCWFGYEYMQRFEVSTRRNARKRIELMRAGQTVPELKRLRAQRRQRLADIKLLLGYLPPGARAGRVDSVPVEQVVKLVSAKLNQYHDDALGSSEGTYISSAKGDKDVKLMINGQWIEVPLMGQAIQSDRLRDVRFKLNLQSVADVLRQLEGRLEVYRDDVKGKIVELRTQVERLRAETSKKATLLDAAVARQTALKRQFVTENGSIKAKYNGEIEAARTERRTLDGRIQETDKAIQKALRDGKQRIATLNSKIKEANERKGNLRQTLVRTILPAPDPRLRSKGDLIRSAIESDTPDGKVVHSSAGGASINLGRTHRLQAGVKFLVFGQGPGGGEVYKCKCEVRTVGGDVSQVRVFDVQDRFEPPVAGDKLYNKLFRTPTEVSRKGPMRVHFLGTFDRTGRRLTFIKTQLKRLGVTVVDRLDHWTTLIVIESLDDATKDNPEYRRATRDLNIEVLTTEQLREFINY